MIEFTHVWCGRQNLPERYGQSCRLVVSRKGKHVLEFADGERVATVRGTFRKAPKPDDAPRSLLAGIPVRIHFDVRPKPKETLRGVEERSEAVSKPMTLDRFDAMADAQKDAAVARAMGWHTMPGNEYFTLDAVAEAWGDSPVWLHNAQPDGEGALTAPPPYFSCPAAAPDRDRWDGEMLRAFCAHVHKISDKPVRVVYWPDGTVAIEVGWSGEDRVVQGERLPLALCLALAAAGMLEESS